LAESQKDRVIRRRVIAGTLSNYAGQIFAFAVLFLLTPFILGRLGPGLYGLWALISSVLAYGSLLDLGIWGAVVKYVAQYRAEGRPELARRVVATAFGLYSLLGLVAIGLSLAVAPLFPRLFQAPAGQEELASRLVVLMGVGVGLALPAMLPQAALRGLQRYDLVNAADMAGLAFSAVATVVVLLMGGGVVGLVIVNIVSLAVTMGPALFFIRRVAPDLLFGPADFDRGMVRQVLGYSWPLFVRDVAGRLQTRTDEITIGAFMAVAAVTPYNLARRLSEASYILTRQFMKVLLPLASELHAEQELGRLRLLLTAGSRLTLAISLAIGLPLIFLAGPLLTAWVGPEFAGNDHLVALLTAAGILAASQWPAMAVLQGMARHRVLAASSLLAGLANLALSVALVRPLGLTGVALGTLLPTAAEAALFVVPYTLKVTGVRPGEAVRSILLPALLPAAPMAATLYLLGRLVQPESLPAIGLVAAAGLLVYGSLYVAVGAGELERASYRSALAGGLRFAAAQLRRL
jgi:O-antigen/teichoic acid export membrane protein